MIDPWARRSQLDEIRRAQLASMVRMFFKNGLPKNWDRSEYAMALYGISLAAMKHAEANGVPVEEGNGGQYEGSFEQLLERGFGVVESLWSALKEGTIFQENDATNLKLWHIGAANFQMKNNRRPYANSNHDDYRIETAVGEYLALPYRSEHIGLLFVDLLIALCIFRELDSGFHWRKKNWIENMLRCYSELVSDGPISARRIRELAWISEGANKSWCSPTGERPVQVRP
jgi:hypothetical protein